MSSIIRWIMDLLCFRRVISVPSGTTIDGKDLKGPILIKVIDD